MPTFPRKFRSIPHSLGVFWFGIALLLGVSALVNAIQETGIT